VLAGWHDRSAAGIYAATGNNTWRRTWGNTGGVLLRLRVLRHLRLLLLRRRRRRPILSASAAVTVDLRE